jgi:hypothetical protein
MGAGLCASHTARIPPVPASSAQPFARLEAQPSPHRTSLYFL